MRDKKKKNGIGIVGIVLLFLVFSGIGFVIRQNIPSLISHEETITAEMLEAKVSHINSFATNMANYREIIELNDSKLFSYKVYGTFRGTIKAGFDADKVKFEVVDPTDENGLERPQVTVLMPHSRIISNVIPDDQDPQVVYEAGSAKKDLEIIDELMKKKQQEKLDALLKTGFLEKADENAKEYIKQFVELLYNNDVDVIIEFEE